MFDKAHPIFNYLFSHGSIIQLWLFLLLFFTGWNIENLCAPSTHNNKWKHTFFNVKLLLFNGIPQILLGLIFIHIIQWTLGHHFGLIYIFPSTLNPVLPFIISFLFLDFGEYIYHVIMHKVSRLWRFHVIHHSDLIVDVSTVFREHPMESVIRNCFAFLWIFLSGAVFWMFFIHLLIQTFFVLFSHSNIRLSKNANKIIGLVFITPNIHQVHHHYKQPYTDRNYGDILSIWDRMFGTFCILPREQITFGIDTFMQEGKDTNLIDLIKYPFLKIKKIINPAKYRF